MKNHRFLWLRNRTTDNRKCEKARNIKEKCTIEMFNTVSKQLVELLSSQRDSSNEYQKNIKTLGNPVFSRVFFMFQCLQKVVKIGQFFSVAHT